MAEPSRTSPCHPTTTEAADPAALRLLLVEDNPADAELVAEYLDLAEALEVEIERAARLEAAIEATRHGLVDAVLLDLGLPDSTGLATVERFLAEVEEVPVIVLTGEEDVDTGVAAIQLGAQDYLLKNQLEPALLGRVVRYARERSRAQEEKRLLAAAFESAHAIIITDAEGLIQRVNPAFEAVTGYPAGEVIGCTPAVLQSGCHDTAFYAGMWSALHEQGWWSGEVWNRRRDGSLYPQWESITALHDRRGKVTHYVAVFHDISEQKRLEEALSEQATHDRLTGLFNRARLEELLEYEHERIRRSGGSCALVLLDIDHFKVVNDTHGHPAGDAVLRALAECLEQQLRRVDQAGRWGGEEFLLLLPDTDPAGAATLADRLRNAVRGLELPPVGQITISAGVAHLAPEESVAATLQRLDDALYAAKAAGRDRVSDTSPASEGSR
ncbi:PAS domain S-box-containing protein/diguanylate cyclase (GGDEF) domain-containing protein [Thiohalospira halophila DSM 15071]|uniref:PAS domain S-box-containing protein/diguanylate cyclase (GGDEF) domain-containing protein n=1 Tax=Thiohalospira halophila DSM 15071 TaxID=1123397 RepID=A0A1I1RMF6_9GAMM|nr:diguanylate cyclase [Thiohalospira halophila]SFD35521.1 PAS domain S-box-containing protein/diguanylate cyclase (GGDEF) domain-containing protein [Thiohalospira halophila DSM 15071]